MINKTTLLVSTLKDADGNTHSNPKNVSGFQEGVFFLEVTAKSGTAPTLDVDIETYDPETDDWYKLEAFTQMTDIGKADPVKLANCLGQKIAISWVIGGTETPTLTFSVSGIVKI